MSEARDRQPEQEALTRAEAPAPAPPESLSSPPEPPSDARKDSDNAPALPGAELPAGSPGVAPGPTAAATSARASTEATEAWWMSSLQSLMVTVVIAVFVITFIVQAFQIPSESMENTLLTGDYLLVDKAHYGPSGVWNFLLPYRTVKRSDIIVFRYPVHPSQHFVKRVIGLPGDRIRIARGKVLVNGRLMWEPFAVHKFHDSDSFRDNFPNGGASPGIESPWYMQMQKLVEDGELIVPADSFFVLGDNRDDSLDSRYWGFVPRENIIGRPLVIYWSMQRLDLDDGQSPANGKLARLGHVLSAVFQNMRWNRMMRLVH